MDWIGFGHFGTRDILGRNGFSDLAGLVVASAEVRRVLGHVRADSGIRPTQRSNVLIVSQSKSQAIVALITITEAIPIQMRMRGWSSTPVSISTGFIGPAIGLSESAHWYSQRYRSDQSGDSREPQEEDEDHFHRDAPDDRRQEIRNHAQDNGSVQPAHPGRQRETETHDHGSRKPRTQRRRSTPREFGPRR